MDRPDRDFAMPHGPSPLPEPRLARPGLCHVAAFAYSAGAADPGHAAEIKYGPAYMHGNGVRFWIAPNNDRTWELVRQVLPVPLPDRESDSNWVYSSAPWGESYIARGSSSATGRSKSKGTRCLGRLNRRWKGHIVEFQVHRTADGIFLSIRGTDLGNVDRVRQLFAMVLGLPPGEVEFRSAEWYVVLSPRDADKVPPLYNAGPPFQGKGRHARKRYLLRHVLTGVPLNRSARTDVEIVLYTIVPGATMQYRLEVRIHGRSRTRRLFTLEESCRVLVPILSDIVSRAGVTPLRKPKAWCPILPEDSLDDMEFDAFLQLVPRVLKRARKPPETELHTPHLLEIASPPATMRVSSSYAHISPASPGPSPSAPPSVPGARSPLHLGGSALVDPFSLQVPSQSDPDTLKGPVLSLPNSPGSHPTSPNRSPKESPILDGTVAALVSDIRDLPIRGTLIELSLPGEHLHLPVADRLRSLWGSRVFSSSLIFDESAPPDGSSPVHSRFTSSDFPDLREGDLLVVRIPDSLGTQVRDWYRLHEPDHGICREKDRSPKLLSAAVCPILRRLRELALATGCTVLVLSTDARTRILTAPPNKHERLSDACIRSSLGWAGEYYANVRYLLDVRTGDVSRLLVLKDQVDGLPPGRILWERPPSPQDSVPPDSQDSTIPSPVDSPTIPSSSAPVESVQGCPTEESSPILNPLHGRVRSPPGPDSSLNHVRSREPDRDRNHEPGPNRR